MYVLAEKRAAVFIIYGKNVKEISCRKRKKSGVKNIKLHGPDLTV